MAKPRIIVTDEPSGCTWCEFRAERIDSLNIPLKETYRREFCDLTGKKLGKGDCPLISLERYLKEQGLKIVKEN